MPCLSVHPAAASRSGTARAYRNVGLTDNQPQQKNITSVGKHKIDSVVRTCAARAGAWCPTLLAGRIPGVPSPDEAPTSTSCRSSCCLRRSSCMSLCRLVPIAFPVAAFPVGAPKALVGMACDPWACGRSPAAPSRSCSWPRDRSWLSSSDMLLSFGAPACLQALIAFPVAAFPVGALPASTGSACSP